MPTPSAHKRALLSATVVALSLDASGAASTEQVIIPAGEFAAPDGRPASLTGGKVKAWVNGAAEFAVMLDAAKALGRRICVDYEHALIHKGARGEKAIAAGWIDVAALSFDDASGTSARIEWTEAAAAHIRARELAYLSPVFAFDEAGRVQSLHSVALTNNPALSRLAVAALTAANHEPPHPHPSPLPEGEGTISKGDSMNLALLCVAAGIAVTATEDQLATHIADLTKRINAEPDPTKFVAMATLTAEQAAHGEVRKQLAALSGQVRTATLDGYINDATDAGAVLTAEFAADVRNIADRMGLEVAKRQLDALPRAVALAGKSQTNGAPPKGAGTNGIAALTDSQRSMARLTGVTDEQYAAELAALTA